MTHSLLQNSPLGKTTVYHGEYAPQLLYPIARQLGRDATGINHPKPFQGVDIWNAYELSWLDAQGKPQIAMAEFRIPDTSTYLIEAKSFKLYLNSFNQTKFENAAEVTALLQKDLSAVADAEIAIKLWLPKDFSAQRIHSVSGICLDDINISVNIYQPHPEFLMTEPSKVSETVYTNLFQSNCPVTQQPDWAEVLIRYAGKKIQHEGLLKYLISFRQHYEFHEQCAERIFMDIWRQCAPEKLTVYLRFTRRGGMDINPFRSNFETTAENIRTLRQ